MGCEKSEKRTQKHKKGLWSPDEDLKLKNYIMKYGHGCWSSIPVNAGMSSFFSACFTHPFAANEAKLKKRVSKLVEQVEPKTGQFQPSSSKSTPQTRSSESLENTEASSTYTDQSMQQEAEKCSLPKVLFAEWLSLDQFNGQSQGSSSSIAQDINYTFDYGSANSEDYSAHGQQHNAEALGNEINTKSNFISIDDMLRSPFGFEDQILENGLVDYFPGNFNFSCDSLYI